MIRPTDRQIIYLAGAWFSLAGVALYAMADYGSEAGDTGKAPQSWPADLTADMEPLFDKPVMVLFAHPLCPCTRATLVELESVTNRLYGMAELHVLFYEPEDTSAMPDVWQASELRHLAERLPGTRIHRDVEGRIASGFGAYTSGQVLLYNSSGSLRFAGGITPSRGHTGTNPGRAAIISTILGDAAIDPLAPVINPVFGCGLQDRRDDDLITDSLSDATMSDATMSDAAWFDNARLSTDKPLYLATHTLRDQRSWHR